MNANDTLIQDLRVHLRSTADEQMTPGRLEMVLSRTATMRPRPAWLVKVRGGASGRAVRYATPRLVGVVAIVIILALLAAALIASQQRHRIDGLLAFSRNGAVYLARSDGTGVTRAALAPGFFLDVPRPASGTAWSPDGRYLALDQSPDGTSGSDGEATTSVVVLDSLTLHLRRLANGRFIGWTSAGEAAVARADESFDLFQARPQAISKYSVDERSVRMTGQAAAAGMPIGPASVSPDGRWVAVFSGQLLVRIDTQTGATKTLYDNGGELVDTPAWSPDSTRIAFARTQSPHCHLCLGPILVVDVDGSSVTTVSRPNTLAFRPKWSPTGEWLAYITDVDHPGGENLNVEIARPDGSERRTLATGRPSDLAWSPDGTTIRYTTKALDEAEVRFTLVELDLAGGDPRRLDDGSGVEGFSWQSLESGSSIPPLPPAAPAETAP